MTKRTEKIVTKEHSPSRLQTRDFARAGTLAFVLFLTGGCILPPNRVAPSLDITRPISIPEGLRDVRAVPAGIVVQSLSSEIRIAYRKPAGTTEGGSLVFHVVFPFGAEPAAELADAVFCNAAGASGTLDLKAVRSMPGMAGRLEGRRWLNASDAGVLRFCRLVRVEIDTRPLRTPDGAALPIDSLDLRLPFPSPTPPDALEEFNRKERGYGLLFDHLVANPDAVALYASRHDAIRTSDKPAPWRPPVRDGGARWLRVPIHSDGLVKVTTETLRRIAVPSPEKTIGAVQVFSRGHEVPTVSLDGGTLVFHARGSESRFSAERAYWLRVPTNPDERSLAQRIVTSESPGSYPANFRGHVEGRFEAVIEQDSELLIQQGNFLSIKENKWVWKQIANSAPAAFPFDLSHLPPGTTQEIPIDIDFQFFHPGAMNAPPPGGRPALSVRVNEEFTQVLEPFRDASDKTRRILVPARLLRRQGNILTVSYSSPPKDEEPTQIYVDRLRAKYTGILIPVNERLEFRTAAGSPWRRMAGFPHATPLLLDLTDLDWPVRVAVQPLGEHTFGFYESREERRFLAIAPNAIPEAPAPTPAMDTAIESADNAADYLIVYHHRFAEPVARLAAHHRRAGVRVALADIDEVFQKFSEGESTPEAIHAFLTHALAVWRVPPTYVCLFGDASSDYRGTLRSGVENLLPARSWESSTGDVWASEHWYTTLAGDDLLPDILLGRISARLPEDAEEMVRKTIAYESGAPLGPWRGRVAFVADDSGFRDATNMVRTTLTPPEYAQPRVFIEELPYEDNFYVPRAIAREQNLKVCTAATLEMLRLLNRGAGMLVFFGHGSPNIWCDERIWFGGDSENSDNLNLRNGPLLPFLASFTCNHGAFDYPMPKWHICISEDMMRVREGGAVGLYVPSGPGLTAVHRHVARALMQAIFACGVHRTGEAIALSKVLYVLRGSELEMIRMFLQLGDPALTLALPAKTAAGSVLATVRTGSEASPQEAARRRYAFHATTPSDQPSGRFSAYLFDPDGHEAASLLRKRYGANTLHWEFELPDEATAGAWTVRAYFGNDGSRRDGLAVAGFDVPPPPLPTDTRTATDTAPLPDLTAEAGSMRFDPAAPIEGHTVYMDVRLRNLGSAPSPSFELALWSYAQDKPPMRLEPLPQLRQFQQEPLAGGQARNVRLRWDYPAFSEIAGSCTIELRIDPEKRVAELDESNNTVRAPLRIQRAAKVEVIEAQQPGREIELMDTRTSRTTPTNIHLVVVVRNNGEETAWQRKLGVYRREPQTAEEHVDPAIRIEEVSLPPLAGGESRTYEFRWRSNVEDARGIATAKVYRTLQSVRTSPEEFIRKEREW